MNAKTADIVAQENLLIDRINARAKASQKGRLDVKQSNPGIPQDPETLERLIFETRRLKRLKEARLDEIEHGNVSQRPRGTMDLLIDSLTVSKSAEEADLLMAQTFSIPNTGNYKPIESWDDVAVYNSMRMEIEVQNECSDRLVDELRSLKFI